MASFSARAGRHCKWHSTQYHRTRRHQDWPQSQGSRLQHRISFGHALFAQLVCELNDQDAVLRYQADQSDRADLRVDIPRPGHCPPAKKIPLVQHHQAQERTEHGEWHSHQYDQWIYKAFELCGQNKIDKDQRQHH